MEYGSLRKVELDPGHLLHTAGWGFTPFTPRGGLSDLEVLVGMGGLPNLQVLTVVRNLPPTAVPPV